MEWRWRSQLFMLTWLIRPKQVQSQWLQLKVCSRFDCIVLWFFLLYLLSLKVALLAFSKEEITRLVTSCQASQLSARVDHQWYSMWQALRVFIQTVLISLSWCPSVMMASGEFTIQCDLGQIIILWQKSGVNWWKWTRLTMFLKKGG